jgi:hypothetical protein
MFSFDDKDISEEPVDFGHSAFDELVEAVDNPTYATTRSVLDSIYNRGLWIECYLFPYKTCTMHYVKGFYSTYEGGVYVLVLTIHVFLGLHLMLLITKNPSVEKEPKL